MSVRVETTMHQDLHTALAGCDELLIEVLDHALFNGGKRIRPLLTVLSSRCCGRDDDDLYLLAAAFEYLHVATLVHDDVIDHAPTRRGKRTVNARFGLAAAILAGDWLHARSMYLIGHLAGSEGLDIFSRATTSMANGEFEQLRYVADINTTKEQYFGVIRQKTGNLIASTCAIGALFAGADTRRQEALTTYGHHIGAAFQVVDDLLDFQGNSDSTGKTTGNDFVEGKITLPILLTLDHATPQDRHIIKELFHGDRTRSVSYQELYHLIERYQGFEMAAHNARELIVQAIAALAPFRDGDAAPPEINLLEQLSAYILSRKK